MTRRQAVLVAKAATYRVLATLATAFVVLVATGDLELAGLVAAVDFVWKAALYYAFENLWESSLKRAGLTPDGTDRPRTERGAR